MLAFCCCAEKTVAGQCCKIASASCMLQHVYYMCKLTVACHQQLQQAQGHMRSVSTGSIAILFQQLVSAAVAASCDVHCNVHGVQHRGVCLNSDAAMTGARCCHCRPSVGIAIPRTVCVDCIAMLYLYSMAILSVHELHTCVCANALAVLGDQY
jgi:hypothetical protein